MVVTLSASVPTTEQREPPLLALLGVTKRFQTRRQATLALDDVTLEVRPREFVCIVGPSGCGKSTLLNIAAAVGGIVLGLQSLPSITWLPMAVLWFGLSERAIIFVVLMGSTFSIAISARSGMRGLPPLFARAAATLGASRWQMYRYVTLPAMILAMVQGMKQGWSCAWRSLMAGELLFVVAGLGHLLDVGRNLNDINMVFGVMLVIVVVGVVVDRVLFGRAEGWVRERWGYAAS